MKQTLEALIVEVFICQAERDEAEANYKEARSAVEGFLEKSPKDRAKLEAEGIRTEAGLVSLQARSTWSFNKARILKLLEKGTLTVETLVHLASFKADELRAAVGETEFEKLASAKETESLTFRKAAL